MLLFRKLMPDDISFHTVLYFFCFLKMCWRKSHKLTRGHFQLSVKMCNSHVIFLYLVLSMTIRLGSCTMVHSPKENEWVEEGRNISLVCATDHPWQWCYWERDISNVKTIYQTVQEHNSLYTSDPSIKFVHLTEKSCGIQIVDASAQAHQVCLLRTIL